MESIVWFNKDRTGYMQKKCDVTIGKLKDGGITATVRNGWHEEISKTGYMRIGLSSSSKTKLFFMASDAEHGWRLSPTAKEKTNFKVTIRDGRVADGLVRFIGDYEMEISEDNLCYIDRKNVLE